MDQLKMGQLEQRISTLTNENADLRRRLELEEKKSADMAAKMRSVSDNNL
jgi:hypothetical protein